MTLDEAIIHAEEVAESKEKQIKNGDWEKDSLTERNCIKCAEEHRQLAEWLKDYKRLKEQEPSGDLISRQDTLNAILKRLGINGEKYLLESERAIYQQILAMSSVDIPSAEPKKCKDCKWWRDSDGYYRRGVFTESKCPINRREVLEGNGYCYMFETKESEE